jgi:hypothetical protein
MIARSLGYRKLDFLCVKQIDDYWEIFRSPKTYFHAEVRKVISVSDNFLSGRTFEKLYDCFHQLQIVQVI